MKRDEYLSRPKVQDFLAWLRVRFETPGSFHHAWIGRTHPKCLTVSSLLEAHLEYRWKADDFSATECFLSDNRTILLKAISAQDHSKARDVIDEISKWGGIGRTRPESKDAFIDNLPASMAALDPTHGDTSQLNAVPMNSLFSKVYRLAIPDFPIYDSRVAAGLGHCVRLFLEESGATKVCEALAFGWAPGRDRRDGTRPCRNPSRGDLKFPRLSGSGVHARSNLIAAWLFNDLASLPCFDKWPSEWRTDAVQSAFFMIGYDLTPANA